MGSIKDVNWFEILLRENQLLMARLAEPPSLESARARLNAYLVEFGDAKMESPSGGLDRLDLAMASQAVYVARKIFSKRSEEISKVSTLDSLVRIARGDPVGIAPGFAAEMVHLFRAIRCEAGYGEGWMADDVNGHKVSKNMGREGAIMRSNHLDEISAQADDRISRFKTSLDSTVAATRDENISTILRYFNGDLDDWHDWQWHLKHVISGTNGVSVLKDLIPLTDEDEAALTVAADNRIPYGITPYYLSLFDFSTADRTEDYAVRAQVIPSMHFAQKMAAYGDERGAAFDYMGEADTSPVDLITRRYPMVAILKPHNSCPQICVYCQRNWEVEGPLVDGEVGQDTLGEAIDWLAEHPAIRAVLLTGGDPMLLENCKLNKILKRLAKIEHVEFIRLATRTPVTLPMRFTQDTVETIGKYIELGRRNMYVVTHFEHPREITPEVVTALTRIRKQGLSVYNQLVYTAHVSRRFENAALRLALKKVGIDPYYTFYPKGKEETKGYRLPLARVLQERKEEARLLPGQVRTDEPVFNVPRLGKNHVRALQDRRLFSITREGQRMYLFHPWEKGVTESKTYLHTDISILDYLGFLEKVGEDPNDYETIWYYY